MLQLSDLGWHRSQSRRTKIELRCLLAVNSPRDASACPFIPIDVFFDDTCDRERDDEAKKCRGAENKNRIGQNVHRRSPLGKKSAYLRSRMSPEKFCTNPRCATEAGERYDISSLRNLTHNKHGLSSSVAF